MAEIARGAKIRELVDHYLTYLFDEFESLAEVAAEWGEWDDYEQLDFVIEWPIREDRLHQLQQWVEQGLLTVNQLARYRKLLQLVEKERPMLEEMLRD